jgi:polyisoprenyl-phosphate glycosyltransferase
MQPILKVDLIVPVYNEQDVIRLFYAKLKDSIASLPYDFTLYFVNDGSTDRTPEVLAELVEVESDDLDRHDSDHDRKVVILTLSRNFGHQAALTAGMDASQGDVVISMDGDGQHPPELIGEMLALYQQGYDIVMTQRIDEKQPSFFKRWTSVAFYWLINRLGDTRIVPGSADFRLLSRQVVDGLKGMREYHRFLRGMVAWMGFKTVILPYLPPARMAGKSKYSFKKMTRLGMDAVFSFSIFPLQVSISLGFIFLILAAVEVAYVLSFWVRGDTTSLAPGWSSLMFMLLLVGGILMLGVGFIGIYLGYIFQEVKQRPIYLIRSVQGKTGMEKTSISNVEKASTSNVEKASTSNVEKA